MVCAAALFIDENVKDSRTIDNMSLIFTEIFQYNIKRQSFVNVWHFVFKLKFSVCRHSKWRASAKVMHVITWGYVMNQFSGIFAVFVNRLTHIHSLHYSSTRYYIVHIVLSFHHASCIKYRVMCILYAVTVINWLQKWDRRQVSVSVLYKLRTKICDEHGLLLSYTREY